VLFGYGAIANAELAAARNIDEKGRTRLWVGET
jgi:hypothetical protein